jgi:hypothetical protein
MCRLAVQKGPGKELLMVKLFGIQGRLVNN